VFLEILGVAKDLALLGRREREEAPRGLIAFLPIVKSCVKKLRVAWIYTVRSLLEPPRSDWSGSGECF